MQEYRYKCQSRHHWRLLVEDPEPCDGDGDGPSHRCAYQLDREGPAGWEPIWAGILDADGEVPPALHQVLADYAASVVSLATGWVAYPGGPAEVAITPPS